MTSILAQQEDTGSILVKVQDELRHLRDQLTNSGAAVDIEAITSAIVRTEKAVQGKAEELLSAQQNQVLTLPTLAHVSQHAMQVPAKRSSSVYYKQRYSTNFSVHKTPGQVVKDQLISRMIAAPMHQPSNQIARQIIQEQYGVSKPKEKYPLPPISPPKPMLGPTIKGSPPLPKANRLNPRLTPPAITERDAKKGILSLCERGLIPPAAELTLEPSPIKHKPSPLHLQNCNPMGLEKIADARELEHTMVGVQLDISVHEQDVPIVYPKSQASNVTGPRVITANVPTRGRSDASTFKMGNTPLSQMRSQINSQMSPHPPPVGPPQTPALAMSKSRKFTIQGGRTVYDNSDFEDYRKDYAAHWSLILPCLQELELVLSQFAIPVAVVDGENLVRLALSYKMNNRPTVAELIDCCTNQASILNLMGSPGQIYKGPQGYDLAAAKIQATFKMYLDRCKYLVYRQSKQAAGIIAMNWIMVMKMTTIRSRLKTSRALHLMKYRERLKELKTNWPKIQQKKRVIIHIPSRGYNQSIRDSLVDYHNLQNSQMGRICDVNDPNVEVIYISPIDLDNDMQQYYQKLLGMGVTSEAENVPETEAKVKFIVPDHLDAFPGLNFCLSTILLYSAQTLKRLKRLIAGKEAYIVPGLMHRDDMQLSEVLNVPVVAAEPDVTHLYSTKSGAKRIFANANVAVPPSEFDIYTEEQLFELLASLIAGNLGVTRWVFKIDSEFDGRGTAYCDITSFLSCHKWALKQAERYGSKWSKRWAQEPTTIKIYSELPEIIYNHLKIVNSTLFPSVDKFLVAFTKSGGVIEACPPADDVTCITVDMFIAPTGEVEIKNTGDQIRATEFQTWALSSPQTSISPERVHNNSISVANACYERGIIGYISVGYATFIDPASNDQALWAIDLKVSYTDTMAMANVLQYVSGGRFEPSTGLFKIPAYKVMPKISSRFKSPKERQPPNYRFAILAPRLFHTNLSLVHYSVFFQMCRAHHIGYDIREREGSIFTLIDSYKRDLIGMAVVESDLVTAMKTFHRNLSVVHQEISSANLPGKNNFNTLIMEVDKIMASLAVEEPAAQEAVESEEKTEL
ncbi:IQ domain-containing protein H-like [Bolinopsis microptera]|uniref:IQ domain-containing protein H-like n=1 Tax=Bolinopsis microptera TaxID=2820187 RepID=UPI00307A4E4C